MYTAITMADRRAAAFQLRPSNIRVAPLDAPGVYPGCYLVVYRAGEAAQLLRRNPLPALPPEQHHLVADLNAAVDPEDAGVHRNPSEERPTGAPDQGVAPPRQRPPVSLRVAHRHRGGERRAVGPVREPVGYPLPGPEPPDARDVALERHGRPQPLLCRIAPVSLRVQAVERDPGPHAAVAGLRVPQQRGRVRGVGERTPERLVREHGVEELDLAAGLPGVGVGRGEVGVDARDPAGEDLPRLPHLGRLYTPAVHAGIHLQVRLEPRHRAYALRALDGVGRHGEAVAAGDKQALRPEIRED